MSHELWHNAAQRQRTLDRLTRINVTGFSVDWPDVYWHIATAPFSNVLISQALPGMAVHISPGTIKDVDNAHSLAIAILHQIVHEERWTPSPLINNCVAFYHHNKADFQRMFERVRSQIAKCRKSHLFKRMQHDAKVNSVKQSFKEFAETSMHGLRIPQDKFLSIIEDAIKELQVEYVMRV